MPPVDPLIEEHWPQLAALHRWLDDTDGKTIKVKHQGHHHELTEAETDAIHQALLRKQRGGSLGLNE